MTTRAVATVGVGLLALAAVMAVFRPVRAHEPYSTWTTENGTSCCTPRKTHADGSVTGDCRPTRARVNPDTNAWEFWHEYQRTWMHVPATAVRPIQSPDGRSHVCEMSGYVLCFVPGEIRS